MSMRTLVLLALLPFLAAPLAAQKKKHCTGDPADSSFTVLAPVYRDCEVDQAAELKGSPIRPNFSPPNAGLSNGRCYRAEFQFVVDTLGRPELATVVARTGNDRDMEEAVRATLPMLRYNPARLGDRRVRQVVVYKQAAVTMIVVSPMGAGRPTPPRPPPGC